MVGFERCFSSPGNAYICRKRDCVFSSPHLHPRETQPDTPSCVDENTSEPTSAATETSQTSSQKQQIPCFAAAVMLMKVAAGILLVALVVLADGDDTKKSVDTAGVIPSGNCNRPKEGTDVSVTVNMGGGGGGGGGGDGSSWADEIRRLEDKVRRLEETVDRLGQTNAAGRSLLHTDLYTHTRLT